MNRLFVAARRATSLAGRALCAAAGTAAAALLLAAAGAAPATAQTFYTGNWQGKSVMRGKDFTRCEVWVEFVTDRRLYFAQLDNDSIWVSMGHPQWQLNAATRAAMQFRLYRERQERGQDGNTKTARDLRYSKDLTGTVVAGRPNQIWFPIGNDVRMLTALQTSDLLYIEDAQGVIEGQRKTYGFRLNDVRSALLKLSLCKLLYSTK